MISFRASETLDYRDIAKLHAVSWQENYRGVFSDYFLDVEVLPERLSVWKERCLFPTENQFIVLAEEDGELLGFCCAYFNESVDYGTYLDNLHVSSEATVRGLGTYLMQRLVTEIKSRNVSDKMYLWVIKGNDTAIDFYDKLKGSAEEAVKANDIGDAEFWKIRYVWDSLIALEEHINTKLHQYERRGL